MLTEPDQENGSAPLHDDLGLYTFFLPGPKLLANSNNESSQNQFPLYVEPLYAEKGAH